MKVLLESPRKRLYVWSYVDSDSKKQALNAAASKFPCPLTSSGNLFCRYGKKAQIYGNYDPGVKIVFMISISEKEIENNDSLKQTFHMIEITT